MICSVCQLDKSEFEFYKSNQRTCKECCRTRATKRRNENIEAIREYDRNRPNKKERQQRMKEYKSKMRIENPKKFDEIFHGIRKRYRARHKDKTKAEYLIDDAIRYGKIKRPAKCESCGKDCKPQAHHFDYSKPLNVVWLCSSCHSNVHKELREKERENKKDRSAL